jgi:hypothetical protein
MIYMLARHVIHYHAIDRCHVSIVTNSTAHGGGGTAAAWEAPIGACRVCEELFWARRWICETGHVAIIYSMYAGRYGGYSFHLIFSHLVVHISVPCHRLTLAYNCLSLCINNFIPNHQQFLRQRGVCL